MTTCLIVLLVSTAGADPMKSLSVATRLLRAAYARALEHQAVGSSGAGSGSEPPITLDSTKHKIISTLLDLTEHEVSRRLTQSSPVVDTQSHILSSNNKRFKVDTPPLSGSSGSLASLASGAVDNSIRSDSSASQTTTSTSTSTTTEAPATTSSTRAPIIIRRTTMSESASAAAAAAAAAEAAAAAIANMHSMAAQNSNHYNRNRNRFGSSSSSGSSSLAASSSSIGSSYSMPNAASAASSAHQHLSSIAALHSSHFDPDKPNFDVNYRPTEAPPPPSSSVGPPASNRRKNKQRESLRALMQQAFGIMSSPLLAQARPLLINGLTNVAGQFLGGGGSSGSGVFSNPLSGLTTSLGAGSSSLSSGSSSSFSSSGSALGGPGSAASLISSLLPQTQLSRVWANVRHAVLRRNEQPAKHSKKKGKLNSALSSASAASAPAPTATVQLLNMLTNMRLLLPSVRVPSSLSPLPSSSSSSSSSSALSSPASFLASALAAASSSSSNRKPLSSSSSSLSSSSSSSWPRLLLLLARPSSLKQEARTSKHV